ncbi:hypothetical protein A3C28_05375 [Candidatus Roizmanbacteria bacterium RIFCSPHIGHO2_02_FULL_39_9]|uniref:Uncharacterized protein n=1 Tax=Candidatus Roizmanbacteria bacterium RIFCSPHIGHO2_02_FULL_39_9 TaxID=1802040 RepID=A0A1F7H7E2_9BACT|nr:MAG: hypothetical protein A3C28_05375 [Candidatus Roizmanbacteria bacterium RIFCSPHIGHO2_02_FULL_39_9]
MIEANAPPSAISNIQRRLEQYISPPKAEGKPTTRKAVEKKPISPEQRTRVKNQLEAQLIDVQSGRARLEANLSRGNCIRLNDMARDWDGEERRLTKAIQELYAGKQQRAVNLLEEEAMSKFYQINHDLSEQKLENSRTYTQTAAQLDAESKKIPAKYRPPLTDADKDKSWNQIVWSVVQKERPELFSSPVMPNEILLTRQAEFQRFQRLLNLRSPLELVQWARDNGADAKTTYVVIEYAKLKAGREMIQTDNRIRDSEKFLHGEIRNLDEMMVALGGAPDGQRATRVPAEAERNMTPDELYQHLSKRLGSTQLVEQHILATYSALASERIEVNTELSTAKKGNNSEGQRRSQLNLARNSLLQLRMQFTYEAYCKANNIQTSFQEALVKQTQAQAKKERALPSKQQSVPPIQPAVEQKPLQPKKVVKLNYDGLIVPRLSTPDDQLHPAWRIHNIGLVETGIQRALQQKGINLKFKPEGGGFHKRGEIGPDAQKLFGNNPPAFWLEINIPANPNLQKQYPNLFHRAFRSHQDIVNYQLELQGHGLSVPDINKHISLAVRPNMQDQFSQKGLDANPQILDMLAQTIVRYGVPPVSNATSIYESTINNLRFQA